MKSSSVSALSGGQMQRLAVYVCVLAGSAAGRVTDGSSWTCRSRTFMRSVVREDSQVGLLLFDEPSASLDPIAEHGAHIHLQWEDIRRSDISSQTFSTGCVS